jgi:glyoxylase-like metal-dependent hydrolase (beta-lactamase superfamily II)
LRNNFGSAAELIMHELDARVVERGDNTLTAAFCFNVRFEPMGIDVKLQGEQGTLVFGDQQIEWIHTPGHSEGSISLYFDRKGVRCAFVQDIGAPLLEGFACDREAWMGSVEKLMALEADILCDGHSGAYRSKRLVRKYLEQCVATVLKS